MPVVLWSDALVWVLVAVAIVFAAYARRQAQWRASWRRVFAAPAAMAAAVVLACFVVVGLLDSLHYKPSIEPRSAGGPVAYSVQVLSVLDTLLTPQRTRVERTYSAPFATHGFVKETAPGTSTGVGRDFPRLQYGGAHLADPADRGADVARQAARAIAIGVASWWVVLALVIVGGARRERITFRQSASVLWRGESSLPWRTVLATAALLMLIFAPLVALSTGYHVWGTDKVGQDVFYQSLKSIRTALVIGGVTTLVSLPLGIAAGIAAGYFKGWVDDLITYVYSTINSVPSVLLIVASVLMLQVWLEKNSQWFATTAERADVRLLMLCAILGLTSWTSLARLLRGETLKLRELEYVQAARAFGVRHGRLLARHILPNVMHIVLISAVMEFSGLVLAEAVLSYIGVGVDPTMISFGTMINAARLEMARDPMVWWALAAAFVFMFALVLAANLFADAVRDAFDPRTAVGRGRRGWARLAAFPR